MKNDKIIFKEPDYRPNQIVAPVQTKTSCQKIINFSKKRKECINEFFKERIHFNNVSKSLANSKKIKVCNSKNKDVRLVNTSSQEKCKKFNNLVLKITEYLLNNNKIIQNQKELIEEIKVLLQPPAYKKFIDHFLECKNGCTMTFDEFYRKCKTQETVIFF